MTCGVYEIVNTVNGKRYVGSSVDIEARWSGHRHRLRKDKSTSAKLKAAWNKYGEDSFEFRIIEECAKECLIDREQHHINIKAEYNIRLIADSNFGRVITAEEKKLRSDAAKLTHVNNPNLAIAFSDRLKSQWKDSDWAEKTSASISKSATEAWANPEKKKVRLDKRNTPEYRAAMSSATSGVNNPRYDDTLYNFVSPTGEVFVKTKLSMHQMTGLDRSHITKLCKENIKSFKGWTIKKAPEGA